MAKNARQIKILKNLRNHCMEVMFFLCFFVSMEFHDKFGITLTQMKNVSCIIAAATVSTLL